mmetsp:Transcript_13506/g.41731  ORF Transcript_13506/g.41731 Transcript_13506/m.41731 type:complete len:243 (-) Transcript_13506:2544-3272(-)
MPTNGLSASTKPILAPEFDERYTRGTPRAAAKRVVLAKKSSSATPNDPLWYVTSFATMTTSRPSGYSGVLKTQEKPTMPTSFVPTGRDPSVETPCSAAGSNNSSLATTMSFIAGTTTGAPPNFSTSASRSRHAWSCAVAKSPTKSYAYVVPMRRAVALFLETASAAGYGSTTQFEPSTSQYVSDTPVTASTVSTNVRVASQGPSADVATPRICTTPVSVLSANFTSISSTRAASSRAAWRAR